MKGGTTTGWGDGEAVEKVKNTNEPKFDKAGVENCGRKAKNEPKLRPQAGDGARARRPTSGKHRVRVAPPSGLWRLSKTRLAAYNGKCSVGLGQIPSSDSGIWPHNMEAAGEERLKYVILPNKANVFGIMHLTKVGSYAIFEA